MKFIEKKPVFNAIVVVICVVLLLSCCSCGRSYNNNADESDGYQSENIEEVYDDQQDDYDVYEEDANDDNSSDGENSDSNSSNDSDDTNGDDSNASDYTQKPSSSTKSTTKKTTNNSTSTKSGGTTKPSNNNKSVKPLALYDYDNVLSSYKDGSGYGGIDFDTTSETYEGEQRQKCIEWYTQNLDTKRIVSYNLDGKYNKVSGTIFVDYYSKDRSNIGYFEAYGDGELIYTSPKMSRNFLPTDISFDVKGVKILEIHLYENKTDEYYSEFCIYNMIAE